MYEKFRGAWAGIVMGVISTSVLCSCANENAGKITFSDRVTAPSRFHYAQESNSDLRTKQTVDGKEQVAHQVVQSKLSAKVEITAVDAKGQPKEWSYLFDRDCGDSVKRDGKDPEVHPSQLAGATVAIAIKEGGLFTITPDKTLEREATAQVRSLMATQYKIFLPAKPVEKGATWDLDGEKVKTMFSMNDWPGDAKGTCTLLDVDTVNSRRVAHIKIEMSVQSSVGAFTIDDHMSGDGTFDLETSRPSKIELSGPVKMSTPKEATGGPSQEVSGTMKLRIETVYPKLADDAK